ncbi:MAG TPA: hypothetical protein VFT47_06815 [Vicinamibacterales bacterium]|nr:hypothetical protein [Vicinamibacterales bacterium]
MNILRDEDDERQTRVDRMIDEFRKAQSRRLARAATVNGDDQAVESRDAQTPADDITAR